MFPYVYSFLPWFPAYYLFSEHALYYLLQPLLVFFLVFGLFVCLFCTHLCCVLLNHLVHFLWENSHIQLLNSKIMTIFYMNCFRIFPKLKWVSSLSSHCLCFPKWNSSSCTQCSLLQGIIQKTQICIRVFLFLVHFPLSWRSEKKKNSKSSSAICLCVRPGLFFFNCLEGNISFNRICQKQVCIKKILDFIFFWHC